MYKFNFNHLYYFLVISEEGSIVNAAKKLHLTQPGLSHQLKLLEEDFGRKLFDRKGRKLSLNKDGEMVRSYAYKIFRQSEELLTVLKTGTAHQSKVIRIGVVPWISVDYIYELIKPILVNQFMQVQVIENNRNELLELLKKDGLDIILADIAYSGPSKKIQSHFILEEEIRCITARKNLKGNFPQCLNGEDILQFSENALLHEQLMSFLQEHEVNVNFNGQFENISLALKILENEKQTSVLPKSLADSLSKKKKYRDIGGLDNFKFSLWAITKRDISNEGIFLQMIERFRNK